jgi:hypothetical protein
MHFDAAERTPQRGGEMGWILETNTPMNRAMEGMRGEIKRRYRVYERALKRRTAPHTSTRLVVRASTATGSGGPL